MHGLAASVVAVVIGAVVRLMVQELPVPQVLVLVLVLLRLNFT